MEAASDWPSAVDSCSVPVAAFIDIIRDRRSPGSEDVAVAGQSSWEGTLARVKLKH